MMLLSFDFVKVGPGCDSPMSYLVVVAKNIF